MFITLTVLFSILTILLVVNSRRSTPLPPTWMRFTALSAALSFVGCFLPEITTMWLLVAAIVWLITAIVVIRARFQQRKAKIAMVIMSIILILLAIYAPKVTTHKTFVNTPTSSEKKNVDAIAKARKIMKDSGWKDDEYRIEAVDPKVDKSTTGQGAFNLQGVKSSEELITYLKSGKEGSSVLVNKIMKDADVNKEVVLDASNWVPVQSNIPFDYPGNTGLKKGEIINLGSRDGLSGDIFFLFISPNSDKSASVRGACANPQTKIPIPKKPEPSNPTPNSTPKLTPKSSNPDDYKKPGDDNTKDSGTGKKPKVPLVTTPPETTPPPVVKQKETPVRGGEVIVDTPINKPGSETGVTAPGATPVVTTPTSPAPNTPSAPPVNEGGTNNGTVTDD